MIDIDLVRLDTYLVLPLIIVAVGSLVVLMIDVFRKHAWPSAYTSILVLLASLFSLVLVAPEYQAQETAFSGTFFVDPFTSFVSALIIASGVLCLLIGKDHLAKEGIKREGEYHSLFLMSIAGALLMVSAAEMITLFLGLEIMSMALYALCGSALLRRSSAESALKYFFLGSYSSAFLLFGMALIYGLTGSLSITEIASSLEMAPQGLVTIAIGLVIVGILFKIGAVPFHFWVADVYQGAPTPVSVYMASVIKISAICVGLRLMWLPFGSDHFYGIWSYGIWCAALLTMVIGNLSALRQLSVKRMLAYSSIAHAGYMLMGFLPAAESGGGAAILFYLIAYTVMTLGSFGVVLAVSSQSANEENSDHLDQFKGLSAKRPYLAALMCLFLLSLAGLPPGMAGLLGKFYLFNSVIRADYVGIAIVGVLASAVSCYYYLRVIVAMYFTPELESTKSHSDEIISPALLGTVTICAILTVVIGILPSFLYDAVASIF